MPMKETTLPSKGLRHDVAAAAKSTRAPMLALTCARLLEQNVRSFLQLKGGVNKGIAKTIRDEPGMFFAYNNGITATSECG